MTVHTLEASSVPKIIEKLQKLEVSSATRIHVSIDESDILFSGNKNMDTFLKKVHQSGPKRTTD